MYSPKYIIELLPPPPTPEAYAVCNITPAGTANVKVASPWGEHYQYAINKGAFQTDTLFTDVPNGPYTITVKDTLTGCTSTAEFAVNCCVTHPWIALTTKDTVVCGIDPILTSGNTFGGTSALDTITVSGTTGGTVSYTTDSPFTITYNPVASDIGKTITLIAITKAEAPCQSAQDTLLITVKPVPALVPLPDISVCSGEEINFEAVSAVGGITEWTRPPVSGITPSTNNGMRGSVSETLINSNPTSTLVTYLFTVETAECTATEPVIVTVYSKPMPPKIKGKK